MYVRTIVWIELVAQEGRDLFCIGAVYYMYTLINLNLFILILCLMRPLGIFQEKKIVY